MKKNICIAAFIIFCSGIVNSQPIFYSQAPTYDNSFSSLSGPNGTANHTYMRAVMLVKPGELTGIPNNTITSFGFSLLSGNAIFPGAGNFTLHLQNTADITYTKSTSFSAALAGMTLVYASTMTVPVTNTIATITISLSTPFVYTGGGIYVAYDWYQPGPNYSAQVANYQCNSTGLIIGGARNGGTSGPAADALTTTNFRPAFLFGTANTYTNEFSVVGMSAPGKVSATNSSQEVRAIIKNSSVQTQTNVVITLNASGVNPVSSTQTIASLASGASTTVVFAPYTPLIAGTSTLTVSVPTDENSSNNSATFTQNVTCNEWTMSPPGSTYTSTSVGYPTGNGGILAVKYSTAASAMLTGIRLGVSGQTSALGTQICGGLFDASGTLIASTQTLTITNGMLGNLVTHTFAIPELLNAATVYYFGFMQLPGPTSSFPIGVLGTNTVALYNSTYASIPIAGGIVNPLNSNYGYLGIEAIIAPTATLDVSPPVVACGNQAVLAATVTASSYSWMTGPVNSNYTINPTSNSVYTLSMGSGTCIFSGTISVPVTPITVTATVGTPLICAGGTVNLFAGGATNYAWNVTPVINTASFTASPTVTTVYTVQGNDPNGCSNIATVLVSVNSFTDLVISPGGSIVCKGESYTATASGATTYTWNTGTATINTTTIVETPTSNIVYTISATGANGCVDTKVIPISVKDNPTVTATAANSGICLGQSNTLTATGANTYTWNVSGTISGNQIIITPTTTGSVGYTVTGTDINNCSSSAFVHIAVSDCGPGVGMQEMKRNNPAKIYPNPTDGIVHIAFETALQNRDIRIVNLLGEMVMQVKIESFQTHFNLSDLPNGIYLAVIRENGQAVHTARIVKH